MLLQLSSLFSKVSGKTANLVIRQNGLTAIASNFVKSPASITSKSISQKACFIKCRELWASMLPVQKQIYATHAPTYPMLDRFGNPIVPNAWQVFLYLNMTSFALIDYPISDVNDYTIRPVPVFTSLPNIDLSPGAWSVTVAAGFDVYTWCLLYVTGPHFNLSSEKPSKMKALTAFYNVAAHTVDLYPLLVALLGRTPLVGEYYTLWSRAFSVRYGGYSPLQHNQVIVVA